AGRPPITEQSVPGKSHGRARIRETRADVNVGAPLGNRSEEKRKLRRTIAIVAVKEYDNIGRASPGEPGQASLAITAARFGHDSGAHTCSNLRCPVYRVIVNDDDLSDEIGGQITYDTGDCPSRVARGN